MSDTDNDDDDNDDDNGEEESGNTNNDGVVQLRLQRSRLGPDEDKDLQACIMASLESQLPGSVTSSSCSSPEKSRPLRRSSHIQNDGYAELTSVIRHNQPWLLDQCRDHGCTAFDWQRHDFYLLRLALELGRTVILQHCTDYWGLEPSHAILLQHHCY